MKKLWQGAAALLMLAEGTSADADPGFVGAGFAINNIEPHCRAHVPLSLSADFQDMGNGKAAFRLTYKWNGDDGYADENMPQISAVRAVGVPDPLADAGVYERVFDLRVWAFNLLDRTCKTSPNRSASTGSGGFNAKLLFNARL